MIIQNGNKCYSCDPQIATAVTNIVMKKPKDVQ